MTKQKTTLPARRQEKSPNLHLAFDVERRAHQFAAERNLDPRALVTVAVRDYIDAQTGPYFNADNARHLAQWDGNDGTEEKLCFDDDAHEFWLASNRAPARLVTVSEAFFWFASRTLLEDLGSLAHYTPEINELFWRVHEHLQNFESIEHEFRGGKYAEWQAKQAEQAGKVAA